MNSTHEHIGADAAPGEDQPGPWAEADPAEPRAGETPDQDQQHDQPAAAPRSVGELVAARRGDRPSSDDDSDRYPAPSQGGAGLHDRLRAAVIAALGEIRWVSERPSSLRDQIGYARDGAWTAEIDGRARHLQLAWAFVVAIPITVAAYLTVWSVSRSPLRALAVWGVIAVVATVLNQIPAVELLVPDWASLTVWPPFSWL